MANSNQSAVSDGTLVLLQVSIDYLNREDISVYFNGVLNALPWEWVGDTDRSISFSPAVPFGTTVTLRRTTNVDEVLHVFSGGAAFKFNTVDDNFRQTLLTVQEFQEGARITDLFNDLDMHGYRIINQLAVSGEGFIFKGNWQPNTLYGVNNIVFVNDGGSYQGSAIICKSNHTSSNSLNTDFASNWEVFASRGASGLGSGDLVSTNNLSDVANAAMARSNLGAAGLASNTFTGAQTVPDEAYSESGWDSNLTVPTKNSIKNVVVSLFNNIVNAFSDSAFASVSSSVFTTPEWVRGAINKYGFGSGHNVQSPARSLDTPYINNTGAIRVLYVRVNSTGASPGGNTINVTITTGTGTGVINSAQTPGGGAGYGLSGTYIIPPGATYTVSAPTMALLSWNEQGL